MKFRDIRISEVARERIDKVLQSGQLVNGEYVGIVEDCMRTVAGTDYAVGVSSGTMALKIALKAMGIGYGDFVIVPDLTFIACASVVLELGAIPVYVDIDPVTYLLDENSTREEVARFGDRIKAVMAVRLGGEPIQKWIFELGLPVLVDSAHSMDAMPFQAVAACHSFYPTKIVTGIEGGALVTNNEEIAKKARELRLFGFGEGTRIAQEAGYKGNMSNVSAALIAFNLGELGANLAARERVRDAYNTAFGLNRQGLGMYMVVVDEPEAVAQLIPAIRHYPVTLSEMLSGACVNPVARWTVKHLISLPFHEFLTDNEIEEVCTIIKPRLINHAEHYGSSFDGSCSI